MNRFLFIANEDPARVKLAALALFTLPGAPIIYYGTEVGVTQERPIHQNTFGIFEEARLPMKWGPEQNSDLYQTFRRLIALRRAHPVLQESRRRLIHLEEQTMAYVREAANEQIAVAFNLSPQVRRIFLAGLPLMHDALNKCPTQAASNGLWVELPPMTGAFLV